ncbi:MAG: hypothetical protein ACRCTP_19325 [Aeromonas popoffii]|uniref:hypothetical protein n=1 Tax=Aeromonas popoffii TaxID=70856 RepID=UPI003F34C0A1
MVTADFSLFSLCARHAWLEVLISADYPPGSYSLPRQHWPRAALLYYAHMPSNKMAETTSQSINRDPLSDSHLARQKAAATVAGEAGWANGPSVGSF